MKKTEKNIVLFDMDNTLLKADSVELWSHFLDRKGIVTAQDKACWQKFHDDYYNGCLDCIESYEFELSIIKRISQDLREQWLQEFFQEQLKPKLSKSGLRLVSEYKNIAETEVILITATLSFISKMVSEYVGFHDCIATEGEIVAGEFTGKVAGTPSIAEGKVTRYLQWLDANNIQPKFSVLYSDSINDLPLLNYVEKPIVVDPDESLLQIAEQRNWDVISMRDEIPDECLIKTVL